jgi:predicted alpha/beta-hydrolase family hydrolase
MGPAQRWTAHSWPGCRRRGDARGLTEHLAALRTPSLILQGERDTFGTREGVESYALPTQIQLQWIISGDHSFTPTKSSGLSEAGNWATAVDHCDGFLRQHLNP